MKNAVRFFINNYKLTIVFSLFLFIYGAMGLKKMVAEKYPAVSLATATIITPYPGASSEDVETKITKPIEDEVKGVIGIKDISSVSKSGLSYITVRVDMDNYPVAEVMEEIQKKVEGVSNLPTDLRDKPDFTEINSEEMPIYKVAVMGNNDNRERDRTAHDLKDALEDIDEVKSIDLDGYAEREFQVRLDLNKLNEYHISVTDILGKIQTRNVNIPSGNLKNQGEEVLLRVEGKIKNKEDLGNFLIRSNFAGSKILLKDVATIIDGKEKKRIYTRYNGEPATIVTVVKKAGKDTIDLVRKVKIKLAEFEKGEVEHGVTLTPFLDDSVDVQNKLDVLSSNAVTGLLCVVFFLFLFLPGKIGLVTSLSLPLAVAATFGVMPSLGMNLDSITILALIIAIGMLVDNSVVIAESYTRYREEGLEASEAASRSVNELWGAITSSALTTIAAFLPMLVTKGIMGAFITAIPIVVTAALLFSLGESFFLLPMRLVFFAKKLKKKDENAKPGFYSKLEGKFEWLIKHSISHKYLVALGTTVIILVSLVFLTVFNKFILFPAEETSVYLARYQTETGMSVEKTDMLAGRLAKDIKATLGDKVKYITSTSGEQRNGADDSKGGDGGNLGLLEVHVTDETKFNIPYEVILKELSTVKAPYLKMLSFEEVINGPPVGNALEAKFRSNNYENLELMLSKIVPELKKLKGVKDVKIDDVIGEDELIIDIDFVQADRVGLSANQIGDTVRAAISGNFTSNVTLNNEDVNIKVQFEESDRKTIEDLKNLRISNQEGQLIRLSKVATFNRKKGSPQIKRFNNKRAKTITANIDIAHITAEQLNKKVKELYDIYRKEIKGVSIYLGGQAESSSESLESLASAFSLAIVCIFALLVFMFNSFLKPLIVLTTIPLGLFGFSIAFYLHSKPVSFLALIGVIGLAGMIVNSGIVLISSIDQALSNSKEDMNEILARTAVKRFKPVLVTSLTTISGLFPTAYGIGGTDSMLVPMTLAMAWGLTTGTILTLIWVPCAYGILEDWISLLKRIFKLS